MKQQYRPQIDEVGRRLLALRNQSRLTQSELGKLIGVSRRSILKWESGEGFPSGTHLGQLLAVFIDKQAFTAGQEIAEAEVLWEQVSRAASKRLGLFNQQRFEQLLAAGSGSADPLAVQSEVIALRSPAGQFSRLPLASVIDWGEAVDVPVLHGREAELAQLHQWVLDDRCRLVGLLGLGGIGKTSVALTFAQQALPHFDVVLFRSVQNGPPLAEVLDDFIGVVSDHQALPPESLPAKLTLLVQKLCERRCLIILDNLESVMQSGSLTGTYRPGYEEFGALLQALSARAHQSCLLLTSREKPAELGLLEDHAGPARTLAITGLDDRACQHILKAKAIVGDPTEMGALTQLYGGNPLALQLMAEPIRELFGGDVGAFLSTGDAFFNGVGTLLNEQFARSTQLEQTILYWLAVERELVSLSSLLVELSENGPQRAVLAALESLRRRMLIEHAPGRPAFTLQPVIFEYATSHLIQSVGQELLDGQPRLLCSHALVQTTAKEYVRRSQERLIATPLLAQLGSPDRAEQYLLKLLTFWREQPLLAQGYGPGNAVNLLRVLRGNLRGHNLARLSLRQVYLSGVEAQDTSLAGATVRDCAFTEAISIIHAVATSPDGVYWAASSNGMIQVWRDDGRTTHHTISAHAKQASTLAFSPNGQTLASGSWDCTIKLWDSANGRLIRLLEGHSDCVQSIAFAPDGRRLLSGSDDRTMRLWDIVSGACLQTWHEHTDNVYGVAWSSDGS